MSSSEAVSNNLSSQLYDWGKRGFYGPAYSPASRFAISESWLRARTGGRGYGQVTLRSVRVVEMRADGKVYGVQSFDGSGARGKAEALLAELRTSEQ
jgi:hypothetical protein